jgi:lipopolysaccharide/colanic/teichoic acid biosynthesis glycosyltransferase
MYKVYLKNFCDMMLVIICLIIFSPIILLLAFLVHSFLGSPILFKQLRPGLHGKLFTIYKFRTMRDLYNNDGDLLPDEYRLTKFGKFLRSTSLDELPELFNVLKGDMSLVGPRPLLIEYLPLYTKNQARRHEAKPGLTGWAQINGRNNLSWQKKFELDIWYVDNVSLYLDLKILWQTILIVLKRKGISKDLHATMPRFTGNFNISYEEK